MSLLDLALTNVRCIEQAALEVPPGLSLICGSNGSGKTSLLEAIFLLGRGRSFRIRNNKSLIRENQPLMRVSGRVALPSGQQQALTFEATREGSSARIGERPATSLVELSQYFPVQVIEPGVHKLIEESGRYRRRWMDGAVFRLEPRYMDAWLRFTRTLRQRNAALGAAGQATVWDGELAQAGELIDESRGRFVRDLQPYWREVVSAISGLDVELAYLRGWSREYSLFAALSASRARDEARRITHVGPHRADVALRVRGRPAREVLSRGQQKLVAAAMIVAQLSMLEEATHATATLLLDDPAAELDGERLERFIAEVKRLRCQLIVTSLHAESRLFGAPARTFQMDQGGVQPL